MKTNLIGRRRFAVSAAAMAAVPSIAAAAASSAAPTFVVDAIQTITPPSAGYCGWPTLTRRAGGRLIVVWSGGRESHVCPFGRVEMITSNDDGRTWSWPRTLIDGPIDDRDAGVVETAKGSLLVTTFTSLAYQPQLDKQIALENAKDQEPDWSADKLERWKRVHHRLSAEQRQRELGQWMIRSTDGGVTWSRRYGSIVNSPHGPIQLSDGRLIYAGKELWTGDKEVGVCESSDDGASWRWLAKIPVRPGDLASNYHELHAAETKSGRLVVHVRNHNAPNNRETLQCESDDGGKTWTTPHSIGVWGLPSFLTTLADGRLVMTYGYRRAPLGIQARVSEDEGSTWSDPMILYGDATSGDLGYPSTVELDDGDLLTVWYEWIAADKTSVLRQLRWRMTG